MNNKINIPKKIKVTSKTLEATFGLKVDSIHECCECPEEYKGQFRDSVWIYSEQQEIPIRCLEGEFEILNQF